jgi:mRNA interferase ChpB
MDRGDIVFVDLDPTVGHEQRGHRPVSVISKAEFNKLGAALVCPIS